MPDHLVKHRPWGGDVKIDSAWRGVGRLARHRPYFYYHDPKRFPCDNMGFRIPSGFASVREKYERTEGRKRVFCFGGSTTFCDYCTYDESYPARLEEKTQYAVFNLGLRGVDLHANVYTLTDLLRDGLRPDLVICYDGANEKMGFRQAERGDAAFRTEHVQYSGFVDLINAASLRRRLRQLFSGRKTEDSTDLTAEELSRFAISQAAHYLQSKCFIARLGEALGFETRFFLQPSVWDYWQDGDKLRHHYLKAIYGSIREADDEVMDISTAAKLSPEMFIDQFHLDALGYECIAQTIADRISEP